jgi:hypothetical protein
MPKSKREPRDRKPSFPPLTEVRRLPRPTDFNFASDDVVGPLVEGGWNIERTPAEPPAATSAFSLFAIPLAFNDPRQKLDRDIKAIVARYVADIAQQRGRPAVPPSKFRTRASKFRNDIDRLLNNFPNPDESAGDAAAAPALALDSALIDAVNIKLDTQDRTSALNFEQIRDTLRALLEAADSVRADEGIRPHRAAHVLLKDLAKIYFERAGAKPSAETDGHFDRFVRAVNRQIPENYQVIGLANLVTGAVTAADRHWQISSGSAAKCAVVPAGSRPADPYEAPRTDASQTGTPQRARLFGADAPPNWSE